MARALLGNEPVNTSRHTGFYAVRAVTVAMWCHGKHSFTTIEAVFCVVSVKAYKRSESSVSQSVVSQRSELEPRVLKFQFGCAEF
jgi:hypothetical protein